MGAEQSADVFSVSFSTFLPDGTVEKNLVMSEGCGSFSFPLSPRASRIKCPQQTVAVIWCCINWDTGQKEEHLHHLRLQLYIYIYEKRKIWMFSETHLQDSEDFVCLMLKSNLSSGYYSQKFQTSLKFFQNNFSSLFHKTL